MVGPLRLRLSMARAFPVSLPVRPTALRRPLVASAPPLRPPSAPAQPAPSRTLPPPAAPAPPGSDARLLGRGRGLAALVRGGGECLERVRGGGPVEARLGDGHAVGPRRLAGHEVLPAREQKRGQHHAEQRVLARADEVRNIVHLCSCARARPQLSSSVGVALGRSAGAQRDGGERRARRISSRALPPWRWPRAPATSWHQRAVRSAP